MTDDLVKRLRAQHNDTWPLKIGHGDLINEDGPEAADRIEKLEAALKPFLQLPIGVIASDPADMEVYQCHGWPRDGSSVVTVADFRRVQKALEGKDD